LLAAGLATLLVLYLARKPAGIPSRMSFT